jgi:hypothetical protein
MKMFLLRRGLKQKNCLARDVNRSVLRKVQEQIGQRRGSSLHVQNTLWLCVASFSFVFSPQPTSRSDIQFRVCEIRNVTTDAQFHCGMSIGMTSDS